MARRWLGTSLLLAVCIAASTVLVQRSVTPPATPTPVVGDSAGAAGSSPTSLAPPRGGTYISSTTGDAVTLQPLLAIDASSNWYISLIYDSLFYVDPRQNYAYVPKMAESYTFSEDSKTLTINLRRNALWSDGTPITAADVVFTYDAKSKLPLGATLRDTFESAQAADPYTVVFRMKAPNCAALFEANLRPLPRHYFESVDITNSAYNFKPPVSSGPFILLEWVKDSYVAFAANDLYWGGRPNLDKMIIRVVRDMATAELAFIKGELDMVGVEPADWAKMSQLPYALTNESYNPLSFLLLLFRMDGPTLQDKRVRQALNYALDRQDMINVVYLGHARPAYAPIGEGHWAYAPDVFRYEYDVQKAKGLLREAGWTPGPDGVSVKDGKALKLRLHIVAGASTAADVAVIVQAQFRDVGVAVEIASEDFGSFMNRLSRTHDFDVAVLGFGTLDPQMSLAPFSNDSMNLQGYVNPAIDRLRAEAARVPGCREEDRQKVFAQALKIITEDAAGAFLLTPPTLAVMNNRLEIGWDAATRTNWPIDKWYVKAGR